MKEKAKPRRKYVRRKPLKTARERFDASYRIDKNGCWIWQKAKYRRDYGYFWDNGKVRRASRVAWELYRGPIPDGMFVCHTCDVTSCVNPEHLFLGTPRDNVLDMLSKGRGGFQAKLSERDIAFICASAEPPAVLSARFKVCETYVRKLRKAGGRVRIDVSVPAPHQSSL